MSDDLGKETGQSKRSQGSTQGHRTTARTPAPAALTPSPTPASKPPTLAVKKNDTHAILPGYSWAFTFDDIRLRTLGLGSRVHTGGCVCATNVYLTTVQATARQVGNRDNVTANGHTGTYTVNDLNQITARDIPRAMQFRGQVHPDATTTLIEDDPVTGVATSVQRLTGDPHWLAEANYTQAADPNDAKYGEFTIEGVLAEAGHNDTDAIAEAQLTGLLKTHPENFQYDLDGNLLSDGLWDYEWDGDGARQRVDGAPEACPKGGMHRVPSGRGSPQNRLTGIEHKPALAAFFAANDLDRKRLEFAYDSQSRRIQKDTYHWDTSTSTWVLQQSKRWLYDQWNPMVELRSTDGQSYTLGQSYLWGLDLAEQAGSPPKGGPVGAQAGGVGGLLAISIGGGSNILLPAYDGHGNIMALVDADTGEIVAEYEYSPFGETLRATGPMADRNPFGFSTKYTDNETGLVYYGFRYYDPESGRWPNRDPIGERGGPNLYGFVGNDSVNQWDLLGLHFTDTEIKALNLGIDMLAAIWNSRHENPHAADQIGSGMRGAANYLLRSRPISLRYFNNYLSATGENQQLDNELFFNDKNVKEKVIDEMVQVARNQRNLGPGSRKYESRIIGGETRALDPDLVTAVGRFIIYYKVNNKVVETPSGRLNCELRAVLWLDDKYNFVNKEFNLHDDVTNIPTREIFEFLEQQGRAKPFQVRSKIYSNTSGLSDDDIRSNFEYYLSKPNDAYPEFTFPE